MAYHRTRNLNTPFMKSIFFYTTCALALGAFLFSCGGPAETRHDTAVQAGDTVKTTAKETKAPEQLVLEESVAFYKSITDGSFNGAIDFLHPKAVEATPKSEWLKLLEDTKARFGKLLKTNVIDSRKFDQVNTIVGKSDYYQIMFENTYENGVLYEMLSFVKEESANKPRLLSYTYNSDKSKLAFESF